MNTGRRSFFKTLGAIVGGLAVSKQVRAIERANAGQYIKKFGENSVPSKPMTAKSWEGFATSGTFCFSGMIPVTCVSGRFEWDPTRGEYE